ncbi:MAG: hypothetical protein EPO36_05980 [Chloroflexota bacterium]|nr:MAG: hypothetical protein EPO36_05980 [Chloroflexota bacterium]
MDPNDRPRSGLATDQPATSDTASALANATEILARAAADEAAAVEAHARFRREGAPTLPPDERISPLLEPGERVIAVRHAVLLDRREPAPGARFTPGVAGTLYVTSQRLVLVGRLTLPFAIDEIEDAIVTGERLLLVLRDGHGVALQVAQPRLLWVEIAAARGPARAGQGSGSKDGPRPAVR